MQACMNTIIICGACDEEIFTRSREVHECGTSGIFRSDL